MRRRDALFGFAVVVAAAGAARAELPPADAAEFIRRTGTELSTVIGDATSPEEKRRRLVPFLDKIADVDAVARFCLGRFWRVATLAQQAEYIRLFHTILLNNIVGRLSDYRPGATIKVTTGQPMRHEDGVYVPTTVERAGSPPLRVTWVVDVEGNQPKLVDIVAEGMSLRLTQRSDYAAFINRNGGNVDALLDALRRQAAMPGIQSAGVP